MVRLDLKSKVAFGKSELGGIIVRLGPIKMALGTVYSTV